MVAVVAVPTGANAADLAQGDTVILHCRRLPLTVIL